MVFCLPLRDLRFEGPGFPNKLAAVVPLLVLERMLELQHYHLGDTMGFGICNWGTTVGENRGRGNREHVPFAVFFAFSCKLHTNGFPKPPIELRMGVNTEYANRYSTE